MGCVDLGRITHALGRVAAEFPNTPLGVALRLKRKAACLLTCRWWLDIVAVRAPPRGLMRRGILRQLALRKSKFCASKGSGRRNPAKCDKEISVTISYSLDSCFTVRFWAVFYLQGDYALESQLCNHCLFIPVPINLQHSHVVTARCQ